MIKRLGKCIGEYKIFTILAPIFMLLEVASEVAIPWLMARIIDLGISAGNMEQVLKIGGIMVLVTIFALITGGLSGACAARASAGFAKNLRKGMFYNIQNFSFMNLDKFSASSLVTRLTTDVTNVQNAFQMIIRMLVRGPLMLIFAIGISFTINAKLAVIFLIAVPVLGIGLYFIIKNAHPIFERVFKRYDVLNRVVQENLRGIRVVKSYVREEHEKEKFKKEAQHIYNDFVSAEKILILNSPLMQFCLYGCLLGISWLGANMIVSNAMSTGDLMSLFTYSMQILGSLMMLSMVFVMIVISKASAERIVEVLDETSDITNGENPQMQVKDGSISFEHVNFSYAKDENKLCLKDIDIHIKSGETIGIIGGTGSAKSSFVQLIPRLYDTTNGAVKVGGLDVKEYDIHALRDSVAMVLQKNVLFSGTIKENLRWGNKYATDEEMEEACKLAHAHEFIITLPKGYDTYIEQGGSNVSGGQRQRLCIARALLKNPKVLILDDSTSAVDTKTDSQIRQAFREEIPNVTKIIIAQRVSSIQDADRIIVLNSGMIDGVGTHEELLKNNNIYQEVYESQVKGGGDDE